ncbi:YdcF family protein [Vibrio profundum]|uniref:ElyC/SanA/YdcF family protein n=1 Tax=Vibrio profundum TaxID=2910247 RepID=UPI003D0E9650
MGFVLKKILSAFLMPFAIGLLSFGVGLFFLYRKSYKKAKVFLTFSFIWMFLIGYPPVSNWIIEPLESTYPALSANSDINAKYILLLGGDFNGRAYEAIRLFHMLHGAKIITSGYPGPGYEVPEAVRNANKLMSLGIPKSDILIQSSPKDTQEEAQSIKTLIRNAPFVLVTSASHMPRAMTLFQKEGLKPIPATTDFMHRNSSLLSMPNGSDVAKTKTAFHEYLGTYWNKLKWVGANLF